MALVSNFGYTNKSAAEMAAPTATVIDFKNDYALVEDEPTQCVLANKTSPLDQGEKISFGCRELPSITSSVKNNYPGRVTNGVQYQIKLEELLSITDSQDSTFREDVPIVMSLTVRHPMVGAINGTTINDVMMRLFSAMYYTENGVQKSRWDAIMRSALKPNDSGLAAKASGK